ncbi:MAG: hypothetical protein JWM34_2166 [Ilumatobacteraceae bacterium]|nr:hypothetical protein [Ilumatobacteraceae bacterium]
MSTRDRRLTGFTVAVLVAACAPAAAASAAAPVIVADGRASYQPVTPCRLADTRNGATPGVDAIDGSTVRIQVTGRCGVATSATAVAVSIAVADTRADGFAAITPAGVPGETSTVNWVAGEVRSASTIVQLSAGGAVDVRVSAGLDAADVIVDVNGAWSPVTGTGTATAGRIVTVDARRILDTRLRVSRVPAGGVVTVDRATLGVPTDAIAVTGTLTSTGGANAGYLTAYPAGTPTPLASNVNTDAPGQDRASGVIVALGAGGLSIYAGAATTDILFDVTGYVTGPASAASTNGLLVPVNPTRVLDTRTSTHPVTTAAVTDIAAAFPGAPIGAVIGTITAVDGDHPGFASAASTSATGGEATTSMVNWPGGHGAVAAMMVQPLPSGGQLAIQGSTPSSFILDVTAYVLDGAPSNNPSAPAAGPAAGSNIVGDASASGTTGSTSTPSTGPRTLTTGVITDHTGTGKATGDPLALLHQTYTPAELAAGGGVSIVFSAPPGGAPAMIPYSPSAFPACGPEPLCMLISPTYWADPGRDPVDSNRVMVSHEWGHVLSFRYQQYLRGDDLAHWLDLETGVNEECLADTVASLVLARGGLPPNETPDYVVHYMCDQYWSDRYGADKVDSMRAEAVSVATGLLQWADTWGAAHPA